MDDDDHHHDDVDDDNDDVDDDDDDDDDIMASSFKYLMHFKNCQEGVKTLTFGTSYQFLCIGHHHLVNMV